jgi:hypothetical protein
MGFLASRGTKHVSPGLCCNPHLGCGLSVLDLTEQSVVVAIAPRLLTYTQGFPTAEQASVVVGVEQAVAALAPDVQHDLKRLLRLFENGLTNFLLGGRLAPFTRLSPQEQDAVLEEWRLSSLAIRRSGYLALRTLVMAAYYASRETWPAIGYAGPPKGVHQPGFPAWKGGEVPRPGKGGAP